MTIYVLPDVESVVVAYLKAHPDVIALVDPKNIGAELPPKSDFPYLQVTLGGGTVPVERFLAAPAVTIDAWGGTRLEARTLCATAHAALIELVGVQGSLGVVTGAATLLHPRKRTDRENNRPVYTAEVLIWLHA